MRIHFIRLAEAEVVTVQNIDKLRTAFLLTFPQRCQVASNKNKKLEFVRMTSRLSY